jgi:hypothetical protein
MITFSFSFFSNSEILLGLRVTQNFTIDMEGNPGPQHYSVKFGLLFVALTINVIRFTDN